MTFASSTSQIVSDVMPTHSDSSKISLQSHPELIFHVLQFHYQHLSQEQLSLTQKQQKYLIWIMFCMRWLMELLLKRSDSRENIDDLVEGGEHLEILLNQNALTKVREEDPHPSLDLLNVVIDAIILWVNHQQTTHQTINRETILHEFNSSIHEAKEKLGFGHIFETRYIPKDKEHDDVEIVKVSMEQARQIHGLYHVEDGYDHDHVDEEHRRRREKQNV